MIFHDDIPIYPICLDLPYFSESNTPGVTARILTRWQKPFTMDLEAGSSSLTWRHSEANSLGKSRENLLQSYRNDAFTRLNSDMEHKKKTRWCIIFGCWKCMVFIMKWPISWWFHARFSAEWASQVAYDRGVGCKQDEKTLNFDMKPTSEALASTNSKYLKIVHYNPQKSCGSVPSWFPTCLKWGPSRDCLPGMRGSTVRNSMIEPQANHRRLTSSQNPRGESTLWSYKKLLKMTIEIVDLPSYIAW